MTTLYSFFITAPRGTESLLVKELRAFNAQDIRPGTGGVACRGNLELAYRACLWSRVGNRVLLSLARFAAASPEDLYAGVRTIHWAEHLPVTGTLVVDSFVKDSHITHSQFAALKVKDAVVDQFREQCGIRPSVDRERPDLRINLYLFQDQARLALDLSGDSLHRRGYREEGGPAPLKENLAAALLLLADWPDIAAAGGALIDPMCGSGTLPIEAALMAGDVAPGLIGRRFGFETWLGHQPELWQRLQREAEERRTAGLQRLPLIQGYDQDPRAVAIGARNLAHAGLTGGRVRITKRELSQSRPLAAVPGLLVVNPPYGERLGSDSELANLYRTLGDVLRDHFIGWRAALLTGNAPLVRALRLRPDDSVALYNGALACQLFRFRVTADQLVTPRGQQRVMPTEPTSPLPADQPLQPRQVLSPGSQMLANRLRKDLRHLGRWARRSEVSCYRLYDADLPEYAAAVDLYQTDDAVWAVVQEYAAPLEVEPELARLRLEELLGAVAEVLELPAERIELKTRRRQRGNTQYDKLGATERLHTVTEGGCRFLVNFNDYLDTGLFLDHRLTRALLRDLAAGRDFLNLFAYTGSASVYAAAGRALSTTSVDLSRPYLDWAQRNLALNGFSGEAHRLVQADCLEWLERALIWPTARPRYGLIFLDPPTFSSSKRMEGVLDVQRDHVQLIRRAAELLTPDGILIFSNNYRRFRLDREALQGLLVEDLTAATIPEDFRRNLRIHQCWRITST
jgi:23S rRNA (guanine2445-N2)-methyltransferase / 23S rRNA (guanine2069-N7)-methyltransferase